MKCHTGMDAGGGFVHTVEATAADVHDAAVAARPLRKNDEIVYGDSAHIWDLKGEKRFNRTQIFPPSNVELGPV